VHNALHELLFFLGDMMSEREGALALRILKNISNYFSDVLDVESDGNKLKIRIKEEKYGISRGTPANNTK